MFDLAGYSKYIHLKQGNLAFNICLVNRAGGNIQLFKLWDMSCTWELCVRAMFELTRVRICTEQTGVCDPSIVPIQLWDSCFRCLPFVSVCVNRWATIHSPDTIRSTCTQERTNMQQTHTATSTSSYTLCLAVYFLKHTHTHAVEFLTSLGCFRGQVTSQNNSHPIITGYAWIIRNSSTLSLHTCCSMSQDCSDQYKFFFLSIMVLWT